MSGDCARCGEPRDLEGSTATLCALCAEAGAETLREVLRAVREDTMAMFPGSFSGATVREWRERIDLDVYLARTAPPDDSKARYTHGYNDALSAVTYALQRACKDRGTTGLTRGSSIDPVLVEIDALVMAIEQGKR